MGKRIGEHKKHIAALETLWYEDIDIRVNVTPILEIVTRMHEKKFAYLNCNTRDEFSYDLDMLKGKKGYKILYLAFHGQPGQIRMANRTNITLEQLSQMMGMGFTNWVVHFGTCGTLNTDWERIANFIATTQTIMVSGYTNPNVDWLESAAMDILYFQQLQHYDNMLDMWNMFREQYGELISRTGFHAILP